MLTPRGWLVDTIDQFLTRLILDVDNDKFKFRSAATDHVGSCRNDDRVLVCRGHGLAIDGRCGLDWFRPLGFVVSSEHRRSCTFHNSFVDGAVSFSPKTVLPRDIGPGNRSKRTCLGRVGSNLRCVAVNGIAKGFGYSRNAVRICDNSYGSVLLFQAL